MRELGDDHNESTGAEMRPLREPVAKLPWVLFGVALLVGAAAAFLLWGQLKDAREDAQHAREATNDLAANLHQSETNRHELESEVQKLGQQGQELAADRDSLSESLEQLKGTYTTLESRLQSEIKKGDVHLTEVNGRIRVDLVDQILFESGQAALSNRGTEVLARVGQALAGVTDRQILVSGHTDDSPITERLQSTYPTNWELSAARAVNVVRFLTEHGNVSAKRLAATGYGQFQPVASNATAPGRARNRRIEILLMPPLSPSPSALARAEPVVAKGKPAVVSAARKPAVKKTARAPRSP